METEYIPILEALVANGIFCSELHKCSNWCKQTKDILCFITEIPAYHNILF